MGEEERERVGEKRVGCRVRVRVLEFFHKTGVAGGAEDIAPRGGDNGDGVVALVAEVHLRTAVRHRDAAGCHDCTYSAFPKYKYKRDGKFNDLSILLNLN